MAPREENHRIENIALAVLALFVAFTVAFALLTRPPEISGTDAEFERAMPDNYKPVLAALVRATGRECDKVYAASMTSAPLVPPQVHIACAVKTGARDESHTFDIAVSPTPEPSR